MSSAHRIPDKGIRLFSRQDPSRLCSNCDPAFFNKAEASTLARRTQPSIQEAANQRYAYSANSKKSLAGEERPQKQTLKPSIRTALQEPATSFELNAMMALAANQIVFRTRRRNRSAEFA